MRVEGVIDGSGDEKCEKAKCRAEFYLLSPFFLVWLSLESRIGYDSGAE